jgi:hypothetical protein
MVDVDELSLEPRRTRRTGVGRWRMGRFGGKLRKFRQGITAAHAATMRVTGNARVEGNALVFNHGGHGGHGEKAGG